jgi:dipeptidyl aminopeptidase/acylaminoacyl peptidase
MEEVKLKSLDGLNIFGHLSVPEKKNKKMPAILIVFGGVYAGVYNEDKKYDPLFISISNYLNKEGFVVFGLDRRGSHGHGRKYKGLLNLCGSEVKDIISAGEYIKKLDFVDKNKIAIHGASRGALASSLALSKTQIFKSAILISGFYDIKKEYEYEKKHMKRILLELIEKDFTNFPYAKRSPINHVKKINCPVLIIHGLKDKIVLPKRSERFYKILKKERKNVKILLYENFGHKREHNFPEHKIGRKIWKETIKFLNSTLKIN